jgi:hypothetical protein
MGYDIHSKFHEVWFREAIVNRGIHIQTQTHRDTGSKVCHKPTFIFSKQKRGYKHWQLLMGYVWKLCGRLMNVTDFNATRFRNQKLWIYVWNILTFAQVIHWTSSSPNMKESRGSSIRNQFWVEGQMAWITVYKLWAATLIGSPNSQ